MTEQDTTKRRRIFLALWPDEQTCRNIHAIQQQFVQYKTLRSSAAVARQNLHMTLHFIGSVSEDIVQQLSASLDNIKGQAFDLSIDHTGFFPKAKILWLGVTQVPAELVELEKRTGLCVAECEEDYQQQSFTPHITLFRKARNLKESTTFEAIKWRINSFVLVESKTRAEGVEYSVLQQWSLSG